MQKTKQSLVFSWKISNKYYLTKKFKFKLNLYLLQPFYRKNIRISYITEVLFHSPIYWKEVLISIVLPACPLMVHFTKLAIHIMAHFPNSL